MPLSLLMKWKEKGNWRGAGGQRVEKMERLPIQTPTMLCCRRMQNCVVRKSERQQQWQGEPKQQCGTKLRTDTRVSITLFA